jgi:PAS domain S-box-containing protein
MLKILHLEDIATDAELVSMALKKANIVFDKLVVDIKQDYINAISEFAPDVILSDHTLPSFNSLEALSILKESGVNIPFILVTGTTSEEFAVDIMKAGAADYIFKDRIQRLPSAILNSIEKFQLQAETEHAYQQLLEASATQAAILNALPPNIALLNERGKIVAVNESWKKFTLSNNLGLPNYGIGYNYLTIAEKATGVDKAEGIKITKGIKDIIQGDKKEFLLEYACYIKHEKRWFQVIVAPLTDSSLKGAVVLHVDITDRKQAEASLIQSEDNLRSVFENTDLCIVLFDNDLKIVSFNSNAQNLAAKNFGKKIKAGNSAFSYFPNERRVFIEEVIKQVTNKDIVCYETVYAVKGGGEEWFDVKWVGVVNKKMKHTGIILTLKNITEKKNADLEREKTTAELIKRNQDLEQFTYIISHNLRAPVANIKGLSNLLSCFEHVDTDCLETLDALALSIKNLDKVIIDLNQILQTSKHVSDKNEQVSLPVLVKEISSVLQSMILSNNATLNCDFSEIDELYILKSYMYSIFQNLIVNSIKYRKIEINPVIDITSKRNGDKITICFKDNGKGIDLTKNGAQLFGLYKRFDHTVEGKGMGLFMVKMQVESLGGTITVESELGKGTEFIIELTVEKG